MKANTDHVLESAHKLQQNAAQLRDVLLANLTMISEIPAPTFNESARVSFLENRLMDAGLANCSIDDNGNGAGILPGSEGNRNLLVFSNADTVIAPEINRSVEITNKQARGPFAGDNSVALAAIATLPYVFSNMNVRLKSNLIFLTASKCLLKGNLEGPDFFLDNCRMDIHGGICVEGITLGRLNYFCQGMIRGEIICSIPENFDWYRYGPTGTIIPASDIIARISSIPLPRRPMSRITIGKIDGGVAHHRVARQTVIGFEARSESAEVLESVEQQLGDIIAEVAAQSGMGVKLDIFARRKPGGIMISHPLVRRTRNLMERLRIKPVIEPTTSALAVLSARGIPGLTLGTTTALVKTTFGEIEEALSIPDMIKGLAQIAGALMILDEEIQNEKKDGKISRH